MPVVLFHHPGIGVAELLVDEHEGNPPVDQGRGIGMPEFVEGEGFKPGRAGACVNLLKGWMLLGISLTGRTTSLEPAHNDASVGNARKAWSTS